MVVQLLQYNQTFYKIKVPNIKDKCIKYIPKQDKYNNSNNK